MVTDIKISTSDLNSIVTAGTLSFVRNSVKLGTQLPAPNLDMKFNAAALLKQEAAVLESFSAQIDGHSQVELSGHVVQYLTDPEFELKIHNVDLNLPKWLEFAKQAASIPPVSVQGRLAVGDLELHGKLKDNQPVFLETKGGNIALRSLSADYPELQASIKGVQMGLDIHHARIDRMTPTRLNGALNFKATSGQFKEIRFAKV